MQSDCKVACGRKEAAGAVELAAHAQPRAARHLAAFVEEAAWQLAEEVSGGAEIPFELIDAAPRPAPALRCTAIAR